MPFDKQNGTLHIPWRGFRNSQLHWILAYAKCLQRHSLKTQENFGILGFDKRIFVTTTTEPLVLRNQPSNPKFGFFGPPWLATWPRIYPQIAWGHLAGQDGPANPFFFRSVLHYRISQQNFFYMVDWLYTDPALIRWKKSYLRFFGRFCKVS